jgi:hypothetical protein
MERLELADHDTRVARRGYDHSNGRSAGEASPKTNAPCRLGTAHCSGCRWCAPEAEEG